MVVIANAETRKIRCVALGIERSDRQPFTLLACAWALWDPLYLANADAQSNRY